jgi:aspartate racemase
MTTTTAYEPTLGILAGMGPYSTGPFLDLLGRRCAQRFGARRDADYPRMLVCSQPTPFAEGPCVDHAGIVSAAARGLSSLEQGGADVGLMACNTVHVHFDYLRESTRLPLLHVVHSTIPRVPRESRVAIVAARPTLDARIYQEALAEAGIATREPSVDSLVDDLLVAISERATPKRISKLWNSIASAAERVGADSLLVACFDFSSAIQYAPTRMRIIDSAQCLADEALDVWRGLLGKSVSP